MGAAIGTTAGVATTTPTAVAMADPSFQPQVETATAQTAAAVVITAVLCPFLYPGWLNFPRNGMRPMGLWKQTWPRSPFGGSRHQH